MNSTRELLIRRAKFLETIRRYFEQQHVAPVDTRLLSCYGATDPAVNNMQASDESGVHQGFLQTSPEFAMKRLLAKDSGDIYQICPAFRASETGRLHRAEFRMLEWYRLGFDHHQLMNDVQALVSSLIPDLSWQRLSYADLFHEHTGINPHKASSDLLFARASKSMTLTEQDAADRSLLLDIIFSHQIQPQVKENEAMFIYDFPREQAAYARLRNEDPVVASRFELLIGEVEIANGYHEVNEAVEQAKRHAAERKVRARRGQLDAQIDPDFIGSLDGGLPDCAGVAIGLDRLMMIAFRQESLADGEIL